MKTIWTKSASVVMKLIAGVVLLASTDLARAGAIFVTGHDPDFHASLGANTTGAQHINQIALGYTMDPAFNNFVASAPKFIWVESKLPPVPGNTVGKNGIVASGFVEGVDFDHHDATTLAAAFLMLGQPGGYSGIAIASDHGGMLTQAELTILNANSGAIIDFLNAGGGLYAMAESNAAGLLPAGGFYGFLPFLVSSTSFAQFGSGHTVTAFGASLGLTNADVNGNFEHNIFTATGGMSPVDIDPQGNILSLATRSQIDPGGVVPEPSSIVLIAGGFGLFGILEYRRRKSQDAAKV